MTEHPDNSAVKQGGRFQPGQSGNPAGRRQGSRNRATVALEKIMSDDGEAVVRAVIEAAQGGDMQAARIVLDRIVPPRKGRLVPMDLPPVETAADVVKAMSATIAAMAEGDITPDEASLVASVLDAKRRAIETAELAVEVERLKAHVGLDPA